jgi:hypothetical protein
MQLQRLIAQKVLILLHIQVKIEFKILIKSQEI